MKATKRKKEKMKKLTKKQTKKIKDQIIIDFIDRHMSKFDKLMNNATKELKNLDVECSNCNATYSMTYDSDDITSDEHAFHCAYCGILMEPAYYDEYYEEE